MLEGIGARLPLSLVSSHPIKDLMIGPWSRTPLPYYSPWLSKLPFQLVFSLDLHDKASLEGFWIPTNFEEFSDILEHQNPIWKKGVIPRGMTRVP
jgi:hypothetical protein